MLFKSSMVLQLVDTYDLHETNQLTVRIDNGAIVCVDRYEILRSGNFHTIFECFYDGDFEAIGGYPTYPRKRPLESLCLEQREIHEIGQKHISHLPQGLSTFFLCKTGKEVKADFSNLFVRGVEMNGHGYGSYQDIPFLHDHICNVECERRLFVYVPRPRRYQMVAVDRFWK